MDVGASVGQSDRRRRQRREEPQNHGEVPPELKELSDKLKFTKEEDGRWRSGNLPRDDEFTLTVEAPGYQSNSQKPTLPEGSVKELEVKLKASTPRPNDPSGKTSGGEKEG